MQHLSFCPLSSDAKLLIVFPGAPIFWDWRTSSGGDRGECWMLVVGWLVFHGQINSSRLPCLSPPYCHVALWSGTMHPPSGFDATIKLCHHTWCPSTLLPWTLLPLFPSTMMSCCPYHIVLIPCCYDTMFLSFHAVMIPCYTLDHASMLHAATLEVQQPDHHEASWLAQQWVDCL